MHSLILLRHGQSQWNLENRFTGWVDVPLSSQGISEAAMAGKLLREQNFTPEVLYTSMLDRAIHTGEIVMRELGRSWVPVHRSWRLNERHYGGLQGLDKSETAQKYGDEQVHIWRRSFDVPPPPMDPSSEDHPQNDPRYADVSKSLLPSGESLALTRERVLPFLKDELLPAAAAGSTPVVAAHGNSLRAIVMALDEMEPDEVLQLNIPTGVPIVYSIDQDGTARNRQFLGDPEQIQAMMDAVAQQGKST
ncbi:MAG: 2,3-diphosphoglycerate-dependent phosphoglycerate mutase [Phycisphaerae bacterium]|nr:2,3-diphosphoglycerate-dependent phosphoglycerate mutase [Phycisphaerae bacterium]